MGVITQGILGGFSGKVGPVVGGKWKDVDYMRSYVIPANPNTTAQQAVRAKFAQLVVIARGVLANILQPFWDPFESSMSGFNAWISANYALADTVGKIDETAIMSRGTLETAQINAAVKSAGTIAVTYVSAPTGNGLVTDFIGAIAYHEPTDTFYFDLDEVARNVGALAITVPAAYDFEDFQVWTFAYRGTGSELIVSDSTGIQATE